ncbi:carboxypeptidase [Schizosaccharomyces cryophilus OY26]|uniref:Inactive metallocarboxypeptidase ECM14 n=1 Tax=Schizosaccharomyces cryophilus (strain OY26 / ATCC MYA-4695 / CBS 11777 / NBRC 106824 / NRRL Y48691) TaxID=653667 RepID=S9X6M6_SCHCR|nr:carboxypeptidase [Schizosaccharomyces cryophilus OY26]EPY49421.1 carboxypeptidase [Schizosaccharomyces cryophilus OY26]
MSKTLKLYAYTCAPLIFLFTFLYIYLNFGNNQRLISSLWELKGSNWKISNESSSGTLANLIPKYENEQVIRLYHDGLDEMKEVQSYAESSKIDIWETNPRYTDVRLHREVVKEIILRVPNYRVLISNVSMALTNSLPKEQGIKNLPPLDFNTLSAMSQESISQLYLQYTEEFYRNYQNIEAINSYLRLLASMYSDLCELTSLGTTAEGRSILGLRIHGRKSDGNEFFNENRNEVIILQGNAHAREWISIPTLCYSAWKLLAQYDSDNRVRKLLDKFEWIIIPVLNVDGYAYTWTEDRFWMKNRQKISNSNCKGINIDYDWGFGFSGEENPCSELFGGSAPFEANETLAMFNLISSTLPKENKTTFGFLDVHSYSQSILWPYAYSCDLLPADDENFQELAMGLAKELHRVNGRFYSHQQACVPFDGIHKHYHPGAAIDFAYFVAEVHWPFTIRLRDMGDYGYLLPAHEIVPTSREFYAMLLYYGQFIAEAAY